MDFSKFDNRGPAETGQRLELRDPTVREGEPLMSGKNPCAVIVRGSTARSVQAEMRKRQKARMAQAARAKANGEKEDPRLMEDIHQDMCDTATPLIVGFENVERDGRPLTAEPDDIKWFLDLTFPIMGVKKDGNGEPIVDAGGLPKFEMHNNPFARQITEFSAEAAKSLGNGKAA